jgi:hypothetical protein
MEWILVHSSASSKERGGRMLAIRLASIVFPDPGEAGEKHIVVRTPAFRLGWLAHPAREVRYISSAQAPWTKEKLSAGARSGRTEPYPNGIVQRFPAIGGSWP